MPLEDFLGGAFTSPSSDGYEEEPQYVFPGRNGVPFKGNHVPTLTQREVESLVEGYDADVKIFKLNNAEDLKEYSLVINNIAKGVYVLGTEDRQWVPEEKTWFILIRYYKRYVQAPTEKVKGTVQNGHYIISG